MPVEAYIQNGSRTAFAYLRKPIEDQLARSFRLRLNRVAPAFNLRIDDPINLRKVFR